MKVALAAFAKTPGVSPVKTRLSRSVGQEAAESFYRHSIRATEGLMQAVARNPEHDFSPVWAVAELGELKNPIWEEFPSIWTGDGGLGERLANISHELHQDHEAVILIGTDCPQLSQERIEKACRVMQEKIADCVVGPAHDGGFYLFASTRPIPREIWTGVSYSVSTTRKELTQCLRSGGCTITELQEERDVDTLADLQHLAEKWRKDNEDLLPAQRQLMDWINSALF